MYSYDLFRLTHFLGLFLLMASLGGAIVHVLNGGTGESNRARAWLARRLGNEHEAARLDTLATVTA